MTLKTARRVAASATFATCLPVFAQQKGATPASAPASQVEPNAIPGGDPTWMVADVGIALVVGLVIGYLIGAWRSSAKNRASHA
jgi:hypothetical protein